MNEHIFRWFVVTLLSAILFCLVILVDHTPTPILTGDLYWNKDKTPEQKKAFRQRIPLVSVEGEVAVEGPVEIQR